MFMKNGVIYIASYVSGKGNHYISRTLKTDEVVNIKIRQELTIDAKYRFDDVLNINLKDTIYIKSNEVDINICK